MESVSKVNPPSFTNVQSYQREKKEFTIFIEKGHNLQAAKRITEIQSYNSIAQFDANVISEQGVNITKLA